MNLYHGSNVEVAKPQLVRQTRLLDFGPGFYTTENKIQAISFSEKVYKRRKEGSPVVSIYEFNEQAASSACSLQRFAGPDADWLEYVSQQRNGSYTGATYELIYGAVADDDVYETFSLYVAGVLSKEETLKRLKIKALYNQMVFASEKALSFLTFKGILDGRNP